jgi:hypothetical protein
VAVDDPHVGRGDGDVGQQPADQSDADPDTRCAILTGIELTTGVWQSMTFMTMSRASRITRTRTSKSWVICSIIPKSPPAENAVPSPVRIAQRVSGSASTSRQTSASSRCIVSSAAFSLPGLLITIRSTPGAGRSNFSRW